MEKEKEGNFLNEKKALSIVNPPTRSASSSEIPKKAISTRNMYSREIRVSRGRICSFVNESGQPNKLLGP